MIKNKVAAEEEKMFVALDISSKAVGICLHCSGGRTAHDVVDLKKFKGEMWERLCELSSEVVSVIHSLSKELKASITGPIDVYVEQPFYSPNGSHAKSIIMAHGSILMALKFMYGRRLTGFDVVHVSTWRSWFIGKERNKKGTDKKQMVKDTIKERFGKEILSDDESDAVGLMCWVLNHRAVSGEV